MRIYAELRSRAVRQVLADVVVTIWVVLVIGIARAAWLLVARLEGSAQRLSGAGETIRSTFLAAARSAAKVPVIGDGLAGAFGPGAGAGQSLASSGRELSGAVAILSVGTGVAIVLIGAVPVVVVWLIFRVRWVLAARSALAIRDLDSDLLALRALIRQPVQRLLNVCPDPARAWRGHERAALDRLAALELGRLGLRAPSSGPD